MIFDAEWDRCAEWIAAALPYCHGNYSLDDVRTLCRQGHMQLHPGKACAVVTEVCPWPQRKGCNVIFGGGDLAELKELAEHVQQWAKSIGCDHITVLGRAGWVRALGMGEIVGAISRKEL